ncbi:MAG: hypothetical protein LBI95_01745 [Holosporales bacterium]|jgi:SulP family sulfate permease|nr:hypothetical protein [Holosporales bacterium]
MNISQKISNRLELIRKVELCPAILNLYVDRYCFKFLFNDIFSGIKMFMFLFPIAFSLSFFCGNSPVQGIISCAIAALIGAILGGSKYQITSIALPICVTTFEIVAKYQYKGLFYTSLFVATILILFGLLKISKVLKHISYSFISALSVYVIFSIIINQAQYILGINSIQSSQGLLENCVLFLDGIEKINLSGIIAATVFIVPIMLLKTFLKGFFGFFIYLVIGCALAYISDIGIISGLFELKTIGKEIITSQFVDNITMLSSTIPSQIFFTNVMSYAFVIAIVIACEACFCTNVSSSITGDFRLQNNMELISTGISNFASIICGGLFVSPNINLSTKNIAEKSKTTIPALVIFVLSALFVYYSVKILRFVPINCVSGILLVYAFSELFHKKIFRYLNLRKNESCIFWLTLISALYFGFIHATILGFMISCIFFAKRMVKVKDATVHTTKNHDTGAIEFMTNKNGFLNSMGIPEYILDKIEVIQISNVLLLNVAKVVEEALAARGNFPSVLIVYLNNVPYLDGEALSSLKQLAKSAILKNSIVMLSGTNGMLLDIIQQKAEKEKNANAFGYVVPDFREAINQTVRRLKNDKLNRYSIFGEARD